MSYRANWFGSSVRSVPRVQWCSFTRKWIVNYHGDLHRCGPDWKPGEEAFRKWADAIAAAGEWNRMHS